MSKSEKAIFTNMCMVYDENGNVLVQDRLNPDWPGVTFPGGHVKKEESFVGSVIREVFEETGLKIKSPILCGIKQFQTQNDERYVVLFFKTNKYNGELKDSDEGKVFWVSKNKLNEYRLAEDFGKMFEIFEDDYLSEFYYDKDNEIQWYPTLL